MLKKLGHFLICFSLLILVLLAVDLSMIYIPSQSKGFNQIRKIYLDLRFRLLNLVTGNSGQELDEFLQKKLSDKGVTEGSVQKNGPRFFYVDKKGEIHFVESLNEIPYSYRSQAQKLER